MSETILNILLVDDEQGFLDSVAERVRLKGYEPLTADSGMAALEIARKHELFAAVVDLKMPDMDGLAVIEKLKEMHPGIKTILLTGFGDEKIREAAQGLDSAYFEKDEMGGFWHFLKSMRSKPLNILLVDDEPKFLASISDRVRLKGFNPLLAGTGRQALDLARDTRIHAAVVDLKMPDMDGLVIIEKLKEIHPQIKTILLTGFGSEKVKEAAEALDSDFFEKDKMGSFWKHMKQLPQKLEDSMAAAGMATGGDIDDAIEIEKKKKK